MASIFSRILNNFFCWNAWKIGWRRIYSNDTSSKLPVGQTKHEYQFLNDTYLTWYADPFVIEHNGIPYIFAEQMNLLRGKGEIAVSLFNGVSFEPFQTVLSEDFHLSFPNVFCYNNDYYMIPETGETGQIRLYKANHFPDKWELDSILLDEGRLFVDTQLLLTDNELYLITYDGISRDAISYSFNMSSRILTRCHCYYSHKRGAGNFLDYQGMALRPYQNEGLYYGQDIGYESCSETLEYKTTPANLLFPRTIGNVTGTHTINRSANYEVVDIRYDKFYLFKLGIWLASKVYRRFTKTA